MFYNNDVAQHKYTVTKDVMQIRTFMATLYPSYFSNTFVSLFVYIL